MVLTERSEREVVDETEAESLGISWTRSKGDVAGGIYKRVPRQMTIVEIFPNASRPAQPLLTSAAISSFKHTRDLESLATNRPLIMTLGVPRTPVSTILLLLSMIERWFNPRSTR